MFLPIYDAYTNTRHCIIKSAFTCINLLRITNYYDHSDAFLCQSAMTVILLQRFKNEAMLLYVGIPLPGTIVSWDLPFYSGISRILVYIRSRNPPARIRKCERLRHYRLCRSYTFLYFQLRLPLVFIAYLFRLVYEYMFQYYSQVCTFDTLR